MSMENNDLDERILALIVCPKCKGSDVERYSYTNSGCHYCNGSGINTHTATGDFLRDMILRIADRQVEQHYKDEH